MGVCLDGSEGLDGRVGTGGAVTCLVIRGTDGVGFDLASDILLSLAFSSSSRLLGGRGGNSASSRRGGSLLDRLVSTELALLFVPPYE